MVARLFESIRAKTARLDRVQIVMYLDDDDHDSHALGDSALWITKIIGPRMSMGAYNSACLERAEGQIAVVINDDMIIRTARWDELVRQLDDRFSDKIYLGYGNDLLKGHRLCTFPILSRQTCKLLTAPFPADYRGSFLDYHLLDIFKRLARAGHGRICFLENLVFEHMHFRVGKAEVDETYSKRARFEDDPVFFALRNERSGAAQRLLRAIKGEAPGATSAMATGAKVDPGGFAAALADYWNAIVRDRELPYRWRAFLYTWFVGRYLASKGWLRFLARARNIQ